MSDTPETQQKLIEGLLRPKAFPHPADDMEHLQTHISHVILAGDYAYKIKKPLDLGFLDFSTLERRRFCCDEELRLNRRLAPDLYLQVVPITGTPEEPKFGGEGVPLEYAVKMRRFPQSALLSHQQPSPEIIDRIARKAAEFHADIPSAGAESAFGTPQAVFFPMQQNFDQIRGLVDDPGELARLGRLEQWTRDTYARLEPLLARRKLEGHIRECHGDMHLGNIALIDGEIAIFDGIEFNPDLRWIDTLSEVAFFVMDLEQAGRDRLAWRFLDGYLTVSGDYEGLLLLDFYKVYRALVRAKVTAIRLAQGDLPAEEREAVMNEYSRYSTLAERYTQPRRKALIITCGVSGSGKSHLTGSLLEELPAIRVRSDVERKRLFDLPADADSRSALKAGIYTPEASRATYDRLRELSGLILDAGDTAIVDATFLRRAHRDPFRALAEDKGVPFVILDFEAGEETLRSRIRHRMSEARDPSEADLDVLASQLAEREPVAEDESGHICRTDTTVTDAYERLLDCCRSALG